MADPDRAGAAPDSFLPRVGVVIAAYNPRPDHLARALESVVGQTMGEWTCTIVDDGSATPVTVATNDPRVSLMRRANGGVGSARNVGASITQGEYLAFLDQDDEWLPAKLERQLAFAEAHGYALADTGCDFVQSDGSRTANYHDHGGHLRRLLETARMAQSTVLIRRHAFEAVGGFDEELRYVTDWDLQLRIAEKGFLFGRLDETLGLIHVHGGNASGNYRAMAREEFSVVKRYRVSSDPTLRAAAADGQRWLRGQYAERAFDAFKNDHALTHLGWILGIQPAFLARRALRTAARAIGVR